MAGRGRPRRGREIDRARWLAAAIEALDAQGHEAFTLSSVSKRVGASTMALYRHFDGRDSLIDAVVDEVFALPDPDPALAPEASLLADVRALLAMVVARPWLTIAILRGRATRPSVLAVSERMVRSLLGHGLTPIQAHVAWQLLLGMLVASAAQASSGPPPGPVPLEAYPSLAQVMSDIVRHPPGDMPATLVRAILAGARAISAP